MIAFNLNISHLMGNHYVIELTA